MGTSKGTRILKLRRWVQAVNRDGRFGRWAYAIVYHPTEALKVLGNYAARRVA
jgi:hypothetical protein